MNYLGPNYKLPELFYNKEILKDDAGGLGTEYFVKQGGVEQTLADNLIKPEETGVPQGWAGILSPVIIEAFKQLPLAIQVEALRYAWKQEKRAQAIDGLVPNHPADSRGFQYSPDEVR